MKAGTAMVPPDVAPGGPDRIGGMGMRAFALDGFGERGSVREVETPEPQEGQVLVRIRAASLNAFDVAVVNGSVKDYMEHRFPLIPGLDLSGVVEALGPGVDDVTVGEEVYGVSQKNFQGEGTFAQLVTTPAEAVSPKPASVDHAGASTLPVAALTAMSAADAADPLQGQVVLVVGSTGGVGSFTTQLLANRGSHVVAVARSENADYARSLGASDTVDYTAGDLLESVRAHYRVGVDAVIDHTGDAVLVSSLAEL